MIAFNSIINNIANLSKQILIVVDEKVDELYSDRMAELINGIKNNGRDIYIYRLTPGEDSKDLLKVYDCLEYFLSKGILRDAHLVSIGGGVTSDFAGLVASLLLRGIKWSIIPTTLLAMVDASIGGKVGVNSKYGKNLIGVFKRPSNIWVDISFLETLPEEELKSGYGEIIKYSFLNSEIFQMVLDFDNSKFAITELVETCIKYKNRIIDKDPFDRELRKTLNFGHTIGHAYERRFNLSHGWAVVLGIRFVLELFNLQSRLKDLNKICKKLKR